jgi:Protein of unknown function (DUF1173)
LPRCTDAGRRIIVKHMPDVPLYIENKAWQRVERAYGAILRSRHADVASKPRIVLAALIYAKREHVYQVDTLSMMLTTDQWIPLEGLHELPLIEALQRAQRAFIKPLKYDARTSTSFPNVLLLDCGKVPLPLHVVSLFMDAKETALKQRSVAANGDSTWVWYADKDMPPFPERARSRAVAADRNPWSPEDAHSAAGVDQRDIEENGIDAQHRVAGTHLIG